MFDMVGIILARGGSVRIPGKNLRMLCGRPLVEWTIIAACESRLQQVILSSDSPAILDVARGHRVFRVQRPPHLATAEADSYGALLHAYDSWCAEFMTSARHIMLLQPTSPLREYSDINRVIDFYDGVPAASCDQDRVQNGAIYVGSTEWLQQGGTWAQQGIERYVMYGDDNIDVDAPEDLSKARQALARRLGR